MSNKYTDAEREAIMATAHDLLAHQPEPYTPPEEPLRYRRHESPERERRRERRPTDAMTKRMADAAAVAPQPDWEAWLQTRLDAALAEERTAILDAVAQIAGDGIGHVLADALEAERAQWKRELHELQIESAKLTAVCDELRRALNIERARTVIDMPNPLPARTVN